MSRSFRFAFAFLLGTLFAGAAAAQEEIRDALLDPLPIRDQFLLGNGFYSFEPEGARVLEIGEWRVDVHHADANTFSKSAWISHSFSSEAPLSRSSAINTLDNPRYQLRDSVFFIDGETHRVTLGLRRGLGAHAEFGIDIPMGTIGGGWSDSTIEAVHKSLRIGNDGRDAINQNTETVFVRTSGTTYLRNRAAGYELGDVALSAKYELSPFEDPKLAVAVTGSIELPTGNADTLDGSGSIDAGARLIVTRDTRRGRWNASFGVLRLGRNEPLGLKPQVLITDTVGYSHRVTDATAMITQLTISETPFRQYKMPELSRRSYMLSVGAQRALRGYTLHIAFIENLVTYENSADAGLQWGISKRF
jgi:hypothetical protein